MSNEKIVLECSKEIAMICKNYYPSCDKAYFQGIYANGGEIVSVDVFFEKDGEIFRKNIVTFYDLIDCHQPRNLDDQKQLMQNLMTVFKQFSEAFKAEFDPCFTVAYITLFNETDKRISVKFDFDANVLEELNGGAHECHQKYYEQIKENLKKDQWEEGAKLPFFLTLKQ